MKKFWQRNNENNFIVDGTPQSWERQLVEKVVTASLTENRRARRWKVFFQFTTFIYLTAIMALLLSTEIKELWIQANPHTSLVSIEGPIATEFKASADKIVKGLRRAFEDPQTKGIILRINSPGGSPVQASYVYNEIKRLRKLHKDIPVYAVIADVGASAAYYIAAAADKIYANESSIVGSIGVLMNGFGFVKTLENIGVERRLMTAGDHKGILDPFSPMKQQDQRFVQQLLDQIHEQFILAVKNGRKEKLQGDPNILFSGLFWNGVEAKKLGLIDSFGSASSVAREDIGAEKIVDHTHKEDLFKQFSDQIGTSLVNGFLTVIATTPTLW
ncbi:peptidase S49 [Achromatium sp. WMS1]|nr:peptidase S49 [Achromatium sp. WMS1]